MAGSPEARTPLASPLSSRASRSHTRQASVTASTSSSPSTSHIAVDPFANHNAPGWYPAGSPSSSTASGGSPRSFYSAAQASVSDTSHWTARKTPRPSSSKNLEQEDGEDDIGDLTIIQNGDPSPQRNQYKSGDRKGKARDDSSEYSEDSRLNRTSLLSKLDAGEEDYSADDGENSRRIEENLRKWAEKEKLRRAKTRNRFAQSPKQGHLSGHAPSESASSITQLMRRVSVVGQRLPTTRRNSHVRQSSRKLRSSSSKDDIFGDGSRLVEVEELELQPQSWRTSPPAAAKDEFEWPVSPPSAPGSATSANFPERVQRAARTGSRFIEDLEDQDVLGPPSGQSQAQTYAQLTSAPGTPLGSPIKSAITPRSKRKTFLRLGDFRTSSVASVDSTGVKSPHRGNPFRSGQSTPTLPSPDSDTPRKQYFDEISEYPSARLVPSISKPSKYSQRHVIEEQYDDLEAEEEEMGWLEWLFCCGCFGSGTRLDDRDEQAGRTFPE